MKAFIDTGGFAAIYYKRDPFHGQIVSSWETALSERWQLYTSNYVVSETVTLLRGRSNHAEAVRFGESLGSSAVIRIVRLSEMHEHGAWEIFKKYADQDFSFTDCTSFALMRDLHIPMAFAFDRHFRVMGFEILPFVGSHD